jgi:hypothetical protein
VCPFDDRPSVRSEGDHGDREDPEVLAFDMHRQVVEEARHLRLEVRGVDVEPGDHGREVAVLTLERLDLVDEVTCDAEGAEDAVLLAVNVPFEVRDEAGQARHGSGRIPFTQILSDAVCMVDEGCVLVHQLADRWHLPASAVLTHLSPPGPNHDAAGDCRAGHRRGSGRRCRGASGSPPAR